MNVNEALTEMLTKHGDFGIWQSVIDSDRFLNENLYKSVIEESNKMMTVFQVNGYSYEVVCLSFWGDNEDLTQNLLEGHYRLFPIEPKITAKLHTNCPIIEFYPEKVELVLQAFSAVFQGSQVDQINEGNLIAEVCT